MSNTPAPESAHERLRRPIGRAHLCLWRFEVDDLLAEFDATIRQVEKTETDRDAAVELAEERLGALALILCMIQPPEDPPSMDIQADAISYVDALRKKLSKAEADNADLRRRLKHYDELDDVFIETSPERPGGTFAATLRYAGRAIPIPVDLQDDEKRIAELEADNADLQEKLTKLSRALRHIEFAEYCCDSEDDCGDITCQSHGRYEEALAIARECLREEGAGQ